jgi:2-polyprenyl-6-methoxyphenol hydroxylase-like FAD-dependent oxidoreductase
MTIMRDDVLIVGAGPTGLILALWLTKLGARIRIIDKTAEPGTTSRALLVHARTLELYRQLGLADVVVARGHKVPAIRFWVKGEPQARLSFEEVGADLTAYSFLEIFPQDEHERLLVATLEGLGVPVERNTELLGYSDEGGQVIARLRGPDGREERCEAAYIAGCDGARSIVRETMGTGFPGGTYHHLFYVADIVASGPAINGEMHVDLEEADLLVVFPLAGRGRARLIGTVREDRADRADTLEFKDVSSRVIENFKIDVEKVNWFSTYHVHHRVAQHFRKGRAFLLGDAAHIHSPVGGQGMNTGIGDAINLAWKLKAVLGGSASDALLDTYEIERIAFAQRLVETTDRVFTIATAEGRIASILRTRVVPLALTTVAKFEAVRDFLFRTMSQLEISYRHCYFNAGKAGDIQGGDRLPWVTTEGIDNYDPLAQMVWQVHVYGRAKPDLAAWCEEHDVPLHVFAWRSEYEKAGIIRDALYLLRPDTYIGLTDRSCSVGTLRHYLDARGMRIASAEGPGGQPESADTKITSTV